MSSVPAPLPQGAGYGVVVGFGVVFALGMVWVTGAMKKSFNEDNHSTETFMVANRTVGTGLTAAAVISSWLYSTALLGASLLTYKYGLALGVWWGASASTMVCFLAVLSIQAKKKAPHAHTLLELIRVRYGTTAHVLWICLCLINNIFNFSGMLLGASTAVASLTGMNVLASTYLMPVGVAVYTYFGGLRATFLTDYVHTFIIMIILVWFTIQVVVAKEIGSIGALYDLVVAADKEYPVKGNYKGSHLTMRSDQCLFFGILHKQLCAVIMDTGFWQKGFSADVAAAVPGYVLGGVASFSVPWTVGTVVGLAGIAIENSPNFPTYPRRMTDTEVSSGLVLPYVAQTVAGKGGAVAFLLTIFMACTSIASAQMIATSSIISFDIYGTYINKNATNKQLIRWSHIGVVFTAIFISSLSTAFNRGGVDMSWLLYACGNFINPGTIPTVFALLWAGQTREAAIAAPIVGMVCALGVWFGTAYAYFGEVTIVSTGSTMPCLFGCVTAFVVPLPVTLSVSLATRYWKKKKNGSFSPFDWSVFNQITVVRANDSENESDSEATTQQQNQNNEEWFTPERKKFMTRMSRWAAFWAAFTLIGHVLLWPLPMYGAKIVFSKPFFTAWMVIAFIYLWFTLLVGNFYPLIDGGAKKIWLVVTGKQGLSEKRGAVEQQTVDPTSPSSGSSLKKEDAQVTTAGV